MSMTTLKNPPDERDPDKLKGPGGLTMREIHAATMQSLARDREAHATPARSWWSRLWRRWWGDARRHEADR